MMQFVLIHCCKCILLQNYCDLYLLLLLLWIIVLLFSYLFSYLLSFLIIFYLIIPICYELKLFELIMIIVIILHERTIFIIDFTNKPMNEIYLNWFWLLLLFFKKWTIFIVDLKTNPWMKTKIFSANQPRMISRGSKAPNGDGTK